MSQKPAGYNNDIIRGMAAKAIQQLDGHCLEHAIQPLEYLKRAVKFSLGESDNLPETCSLEDGAQNIGPVNLPFDLMAIETTSNEGNGDHDVICLYQRISPEAVRIFVFVKWSYDPVWNVIGSSIELHTTHGQPHQKRVCRPDLPETNREAAIGISDIAILILRSMNALLACNNVTTETVAAPASDSRLKLGKRKRKLLKFEYRILTLKGRRAGGHGSAANHQSARRLHLRRGHIRHLQSGKSTWVTCCMVGSGSKGFIRKDYAVEVLP